MYTKDEVYKATLEYFNGDDLAANVWMSKYALKNKDGQFLELTPTHTHKRLAKEIARIEQKYPNPVSEEVIFNLIKDFKYIVPQGSPMAGIGNKFQIVSISNCFYLDHKGDSYGSIMDIDEKLTHIFKRRGGCIWENQKVYIKEKGLIPIKDVQIGDNVLSFDIELKKNVFKKVKDWFYTDVKKDDQVEIFFNNGSLLKTSINHPILTLTESGYVYKKPIELQKGDVCISYKTKLDLEDQEINDMAWFIGAFIGDGSFDNKSGYKHKSGRFRIRKDNKNVVQKFANILNKLNGGSVNISKNNEDKYKVEMWDCCSVCLNNLGIFDNIFNYDLNKKKTFSATTPKFILKNKKYWLSYIAGLIDTDGHIKNGTSICIDLCAKNIIDDLAQILSILGVRCSVSKKVSKRLNEKVIYRLRINSNNEIHLKIQKFMNNDKKISDIRNTKEFSLGFPIFDHEIRMFYEKYNELSFLDDKILNRLCKSLKYCNIHKKAGINLLNDLLNLNIISENEYFNFLNRIVVTDIVKDIEDRKYIDLKVEDVNNYFAGEFGFINTHNCGIDISKLRPMGSRVTNAALSSSGAVSFAERYSYTAREVGAEGRRAALMISMSVKHPDIDFFIDSKLEKGKITGANISVKITDDFMEAVKNDDDYIQHFPIEIKDNFFNSLLTTFIKEKVNKEYDKLYTLSDKFYVKKIKAKKLWDKIIKNAKKSAEPGVLFWDKFKQESPSDGYEGFELQGVNPCAELSLSDSESCRLMVLNLYSYVINPFTNKAVFDWDLFKKHSFIAQRFMDDIVDIEIEKVNEIINKIKFDPEIEIIKDKERLLWEEINRKSKDGRRTGLGITAEGDMLAALGFTYGTKEATEYSVKIHKIFAVEAYKSSIQLAKERGCFPIWDYEKEKNNPFINRIIGQYVVDNIKDSIENIDGKWVDDYLKYGRRNIACLTIAPTGTTSLMTQTSSGIEPVFEVVYKRRRKVEKGSIKNPIIDEVGDHWEEYKVFHPKFVEWCRINKGEGFAVLDLYNFSNEELAKLIKDSPYYKATANEIDYLEKVRMQGEIQKWIDHSISVTHNLPKGISEEEVSKIYMKAYEVGTKGCTIYVDGSRSGVLIKEEKKEIKGRPESLVCDIYATKVKGNDWIVLIGLKDNVPYEIFAFKQKNLKITHDLPNSQLIKRKEKDRNYYDLIANSHFRLEDIASLFDKGEEQALTRSISLLLRYNIPIVEIIDQLEKSEGTVVELSKALVRVLKKYLKKEDQLKAMDECPNCGSNKFNYNSGCVSCSNCGWSRC